MSKRQGRIIVATMKDEGPFIIEWLAYHKHIGFDHFVIYSNDCWDQTQDILNAVENRFGIVTHFDNPGRKERGKGLHHDPQRRAYQRATDLEMVRQADLVFVCDADEFLNLHPGEGCLSDLLAFAPPFEAMSFTWRLFGANNIRELVDEPVIEQFTRCRPDEIPVQIRKWGVKTLFRPQRVTKIGVHRPYHIPSIRLGETPIKWLNANGDDISEHFRDNHWFQRAETHGSTFGEVNHYAIRSMESFLVKKQRGSANSSDKNRIDLKYLNLYNHNEETNKSIQRHIPAVRQIIKNWFDEAPELEVLHNEALAFHKRMSKRLQEILLSTSPQLMRKLNMN